MIDTFIVPNIITTRGVSVTSLGDFVQQHDDAPTTQYQFTCFVLEPLKVGDMISGHIEYRVKTEVNSRLGLESINILY